MFRTRLRQMLASLLLGLALLIFVLLQGEALEEVSDLRSLFLALLTHFGAAGSLLLLYLEESGVPLPLPGDVILLYLGAHSPLVFPLTLVAVTLVVAAGASNLYWLSRRFAPFVLASPAARAFFYLSPARLERAHAWFDRWGVLALIFGRHIPGLRIPLTVVAGSLRLPYRFFLPSVCCSAFLWALIWLTLGARYAPRAEIFLAAHAWLYTLFVFALLGFFAVSTMRALRAAREAKAGN